MKEDKIFNALGYRIIRVPYFVQLSSPVIKQLFGIDVDYHQIFPHGFIVNNKNFLPCEFCELGIERFKDDLKKFYYIKNEIVDSLKKKVSELTDTDCDKRNYILPPSLFYLLN